MTSGDFVLIVSSTLLNHFVQMIGIFFVQNLKQWFSEAECKNYNRGTKTHVLMT